MPSAKRNPIGQRCNQVTTADPDDQIAIQINKKKEF